MNQRGCQERGRNLERRSGLIGDRDERGLAMVTTGVTMVGYYAEPSRFLRSGYSQYEARPPRDLSVYVNDS